MSQQKGIKTTIEAISRHHPTQRLVGKIKAAMALLRPFFSYKMLPEFKVSA